MCDRPAPSFFATLRACAVGIALVVAAPAASLAQVFQTEATSAVVIDHNTGQVLLSKLADVPLPPASMSKLMTLLMTYEALEDGRLTLDTILPVSEHAMSFGGSTMFLDTTDRVRVEDLIRGIIVLSGNDACVVLAEALSPDGTEEGFAEMMTQRARDLGMTQSSFRNASGWPALGHVMSMKDLAFIAEKIITDFPEYYTMFAETEFAFDGRAPSNTRNRNPLLRLDIGADGLKTGHTQEAGYGLVGSALQGERRVTFVISGLETEAARAREAERIVNWAFRQFAQTTVLTEGTVVGEAPVFMGAASSVPLVAGADVSLLMPAVGDRNVSGEIKFDGPLSAPLTAGTEVGTFHVTVADMTPVTVPLRVAADVEPAGILRRIQLAGEAVLARLLGGAADARPLSSSEQ
ncbi:MULTISPECIES: D-alanyl-D-alanine carboxypeptidase family protein [Thalassobacter]|uniref:D-alanyl-D-alanine carboxypeptidase family protein n=1 Tax=Thalassobacter TaxID=266808 RepID=UPI00051E107E|nr:MULTISPECIES: D-alanyl-D-alanine carboxypeptidase family protein [Thalassobacter]KGL00894.1 D-Ala-D-Ala carboxypeptidase [Thalassobacter sp. 16PALIMAR09]